MALESGMRRVRMVGAEHWTDSPERELPTVAAGGDTYAVHERVCIDSARVRLVLAEGEDVAAALREVYGEAVRDVRVFRLVDSPAEVVEGLPEWRFTLPLTDDVEHDPLPGMIARLAGAAPVAAAEPEAAHDAAEQEGVAVEPEAIEPEAVEPEAELKAVPLLEPVVEDALPALEPVAEAAAEAPADPPPFVLPEGLVMPEEPAPDVEVPALEAPAPEVPAFEVPVLEAPAPEPPSSEAPVLELEAPAAEEDGRDALAAAAAAAALVVADAPAEDPFALPEESSFPVEAAEQVEAEAVDVLPPADVAEPGDVLAETAEIPVVADAVDGTVEPAEAVAAADAAAEPEPEAGEEPEAVEAPAEPEPEPEPDPRDLAFAPTAAAVAAGRPTCAAVDREGPCAAASDVVWQTEAGAAWACAWHWPSAMAGYPGAEVGAVHTAGAWSTWRDDSSVDLARQGADLFAEAAREHGHVARPLVALDRLDEMLKSLPDDLRGAILLWSIAVTNPDWDVAVVAEHGRATHELVVAQGRAVAFPDEIYFQQDVAHAPITPAGADAEPAPVASTSGESLFARGTALASAGDLRAAAQAWTEAAESHNHALSMRALGDLSSDRDDPKTAEEWYGRAAMLNDTSSMVRIATLLEGRGQQERAAEWLRRAARFGDEEATRRLQNQGVVGASA